MTAFGTEHVPDILPVLTAVLPRDIKPGDRIMRRVRGQTAIVTVREVKRVSGTSGSGLRYKVYLREYDALPDNRKPWAQYRYLVPFTVTARTYLHAAVEFAVQGDYGYGWETVCTEVNKHEANDRLAEYREAEPGVPHRVRRQIENVEEE